VATFDARQPFWYAGVGHVIQIAVTGSECTGKTTLAEALAAHYGTVWVPEFARQFLICKSAAPEYEDVEAIARGQIALEDERAGMAFHILIKDTDLLSNIVYSQHYYGDCPHWIELAFEKRAADLYLLTDIDVPWVPDGEQRDRGARRDEMHELFRSALIDRRLEFIEIRSSHGERLDAAISAIYRLIHG
jgi:NadR type nicotinamide-nucleotide adenylyltransferase